MSNPIHIALPFTPEVIEGLNAGDRLLLEGPMLVGRDQVHERLAGLLNSGEPLPVSLEGETMYYMGPTPARPGGVIGSCGPTTSARMDLFTPLLMENGISCTIGKGPRSSEVGEAVRRRKGLYLYAYGGCGALYSRRVISKKVLAFEDFGPEALLRIEVRDFPVVVAIDSRGNTLF